MCCFSENKRTLSFRNRRGNIKFIEAHEFYFFRILSSTYFVFVRPMHTSWTAAAATTKFWSVKSSCNSCNWRTSSPWSRVWKCRSIVVYRVSSSSRSRGNIIAYSAENKNIIMSLLTAVRSICTWKTLFFKAWFSLKGIVQLKKNAIWKSGSIQHVSL